jgi:hypothetical protein
MTLSWIKSRYTSQEILQIFVYSSFPMHVWTIINMFKDVPSWAIYMKYKEMIGSVAYTLALTLFETILIFVPVFLIGLAIPRRWMSDKYIPLVSVLLIEAALITIRLQYFIKFDLPKKKLLLACLPILLLSAYFALKKPWVKALMKGISERMALLSMIYVAFDVLGLLIVIARNV